MKYRTLGRTGLQVSEVGFGGAGIGHAWGQTTDEEGIRAVRRAVDLGINFFDTSPMYGAGKSEENLGKGLEGHRSQVYVATKVRLQSEEELEDLDAAVRRSVEQSLRRLRTDYIDILQVHHQVGLKPGHYLAVADPPRYALLLTREHCLALGQAMLEIVKEGKVRFRGITAWDGHPEVVQGLLESGQFDTAQVLYNMLNQTALTSAPDQFGDIYQGQVLPIAEQHNIGVIVIRSHAAGALVDTLDRPVKPDSAVARDYARAQRLAFFRKGPYKTLSQVALRFCLDSPFIATVVPGFKNSNEVQEAAACSDLPPLPQEDISELQRLYGQSFAG